MQANKTHEQLPDVFGKETAAFKLGICRRNLDYAIAARKIGFVRLGHLVKFRQCDIDAFIARHVIAPRAGSGAI